MLLHSGTCAGGPAGLALLLLPLPAAGAASGLVCAPAVAGRLTPSGLLWRVLVALPRRMGGLPLEAGPLGELWLWCSQCCCSEPAWKAPGCCGLP
jgi:hypothetical protein